jgi:hypothetical protein
MFGGVLGKKKQKKLMALMQADEKKFNKLHREAEYQKNVGY